MFATHMLLIYILDGSGAVTVDQALWLVLRTKL